MSRTGMIRVCRRLALIVALLVLTLGLVLTTGIIWLRSTSGEDWLRPEVVSRLNALMETDGLRISVDSLQGPLPERLRVRGLVLEDAHGPWLTVGEAELRLDLAALLQPAVLSPLLAVRDVQLLRLPELPPSPPSDTDFPKDLLSWYPQWLRFIRVDSLRLERVSLPASLLGLPEPTEATSTQGSVVLSAEGALSVPHGDEIRTDLTVHRVDGVAETLNLSAALRPSNEQLRLQLRFAEGEGGLVTALVKDSLQDAGVPLPTSLEMTLDGDAPLTGWDGKLSLTAGGLARTQGQVGVSLGDETVLRVDLKTEAVPEAPQHWRALGPVVLQTEARLGADAVSVPQARLTLGAGEIVVDQVRVGLHEGGALAGAVRLQLTRPQDLTALLGEQTAPFASANMTLNAAGTLAAPDLRLLAELHGLHTSAAGAEIVTVEASLTGTLAQPEARLRLHSPAVSASDKQFQNLAAEVHLAGEAVDRANPLASVGRGELAVDVITPHGPARLRLESALSGERLTLSNIQLTGVGVGVDGGISLPLAFVSQPEGSVPEPRPEGSPLEPRADGKLTVRVNDWAALSALLPMEVGADKAEARLVLTPDNGQSATLDWDIRGLRIAGEGAGGGVAVSSLSGSVKGRALLTAPQLTFSARLGDGSADEAHWKGATADFSGDAARQTAKFSASLDSLTYARVGEVYPIMGNLSGSLVNQKTLACTLSVSGLGLDPLEGRVNVPVRFVDGLPDIPLDGPLSGELRWKGALASLWRLVPLANTRVRGDAVVDVKLGGTVSNPQPSGIVRLDKVLFQDLAQAFEVSNIMAEIILQANGSGKARVQGTDGRTGTFQLSGSVGPASAGFPLDIQGSIDRLMPLQRRDVRVSLSGTARVTGTVAAPDVLADITVANGQVLLEQLPSGGIDTLDVVDSTPTSTPGSFENSNELSSPASPPPAVGRLAVTVTVPNRFYVRGHGIESEWKGQLRINGPFTNPAVAGELSSMRGTLSFLGKTFVLKRGSVAFDGGTPPRPMLDIQVSYAQQNFTALITLSGPATRPRLKLSSQPSMPTDEIVAQILFGRPAGGLARGEALQLAATVASLTVFGQGGGLMDLTRNAFGLDVLRLGSSRPGGSSMGLTNSAFDAPGTQSISPGDASEDDLTVEVGKYVLDNVYVGLEQGMDSRSTGVVVDIEISPNLNLEARTNGRGSDVEATWSWDY